MYVTETWFVKGEDAKKDELAPCGYTAESFPRSSGSPGGGIAIIYRDSLSKHLTIKQKFSFNHSSFQLIQSSLTHGALHLFCLYRPPLSRKNRVRKFSAASSTMDSGSSKELQTMYMTGGSRGEPSPVFVSLRDQKPFQCGLCNTAFHVNRELVVHVKAHLSTKPFQCGYCKVSYITNLELTVHVTSHNSLFLHARPEEVSAQQNLRDIVQSRYRDTGVKGEGIQGTSPDTSGTVCETSESKMDSGHQQAIATTPFCASEIDSLDRNLQDLLKQIEENTSLSGSELSHDCPLPSPVVGSLEMSVEEGQDRPRSSDPDEGDPDQKAENVTSCGPDQTAGGEPMVTEPDQSQVQVTGKTEDSAASCPDKSHRPQHVSCGKNRANKPFVCSLCGNRFEEASDVGQHFRSVHRVGKDQIVLPSPESCPGDKEGDGQSEEDLTFQETSDAAQFKLPHHLRGHFMQKHQGWKQRSASKARKKPKKLEIEDTRASRPTNDSGICVKQEIDNAKSSAEENSSVLEDQKLMFNSSEDQRPQPQILHVWSASGRPSSASLSEADPGTVCQPSVNQSLNKTTSAAMDMPEGHEKGSDLVRNCSLPSAVLGSLDMKLEEGQDRPRSSDPDEGDPDQKTENMTSCGPDQTAGGEPMVTEPSQSQVQVMGKIEDTAVYSFNKSDLLEPCGKNIGHKPFACCLCGERFEDSKFVGQHFRSVHRVGKDQIVLPSPESCHEDKEAGGQSEDDGAFWPTSGDSQVFKCHVCKQEFKFRNNMNDHIVKVHSEKELRVFECGLCLLRFKMAHVLRDHFEGKHLKCELLRADRGKPSATLWQPHTSSCSLSGASLSQDPRSAGPAVVSKDTTAAIADDSGSVRGNLISGSSEHFQCKVCQAEFKYRYHLRRHVSLDHCDARHQKPEVHHAHRGKPNATLVQPHTSSRTPSGASVSQADIGTIITPGDHSLTKVTSAAMDMPEGHEKSSDLSRDCPLSSAVSVPSAGRDQTAGGELMVTEPGQSQVQVMGKTEDTAVYSFNKSDLLEPCGKNIGHKPFACCLCGKRFEDSKFVAQHFRSVHRVGKDQIVLPSPESCHEDKEAGGQSEDDGAFWPTSGDSQVFKCHVCKQEFKFRNNMNDHIVKIHSEKELRVFECGLCLHRFKMAHVLRDHFEGRHLKCELLRDDRWKHVAPFVQPVTSSCSLSGASLSQAPHSADPAVVSKDTTAAIADDSGSVCANLISGSSEHFQCKVCQAEFKYRYYLRRHVSLVHGNVGLGMFEGGVCGRRLKHARQLKAHVVTHHCKVKSQQKPHQCSLCGQKYTLFRHLRKHQKSCPGHGQPPGSSMTREISDPQLERVPSAGPDQTAGGEPMVTEPGQSQVQVTGKIEDTAVYSFNKSDLLEPCGKNIGHKPFACCLCGKRFEDSKFVGQHFRSVHRVGKDQIVLPSPESCHEDKEAGGQSEDDGAFWPTSGDSQVFKCHVCKQEFKFRNNMNDHIVKIHSEKELRVFECGLCLHRFKMAHVLRDHFEGRHLKCELLRDDRGKHVAPFVQPVTSSCSLSGASLSQAPHSADPAVVSKDTTAAIADDSGSVCANLISGSSEHFQCKVCQAEFKYRYHLRRHVSTDHLDARHRKPKVHHAHRGKPNATLVQPHTSSCTPSGASVSQADIGPIITPGDQSLTNDTSSAVDTTEGGERSRCPSCEEPGTDTDPQDADTEDKREASPAQPEASGTERMVCETSESRVDSGHQQAIATTPFSASEVDSLDRNLQDLLKQIGENTALSGSEISDGEEPIVTETGLSEVQFMKKAENSTVSSDKSHLPQHSSGGMNGANEPFVCSLCGKRFEGAKFVGQHFRSVHKKGKDQIVLRHPESCLEDKEGDGQSEDDEDTSGVPQSFECCVCEQKFQLRNDLNEHIVSFHGKEELRAFECGLCSDRFKLVHHLKDHFEARHLKPKQHCIRRGKRHAMLVQPRNSSRTASGASLPQADIGTIITPGDHSLTKDTSAAMDMPEGHEKSSDLNRDCPLSSAATDQTAGGEPMVTEPGQSQVQVTGKTEDTAVYSFNKSDLLEPCGKNIGHNPFACSLCGERFEDSKFVGQHFRSVHRVGKDQIVLPSPESCHEDKEAGGQSEDDGAFWPTSGDSQVFKCHVCKQEFKFRSSLNDHIVKVHSEKELRVFECGLCLHRFKMAHVLRDHFEARHLKSEDREVLRTHREKPSPIIVQQPRTSSCTPSGASVSQTDIGPMIKPGDHSLTKDTSAAMDMPEGHEKSSDRSHVCPLPSAVVGSLEMSVEEGQERLRSSDPDEGDPDQKAENLTSCGPDQTAGGEPMVTEPDQSQVQVTGKTEDSAASCPDKSHRPQHVSCGKNRANKPFVCSLCGNRFERVVLMGQHFRSVYRIGKDQIVLPSPESCHGQSEDDLTFQETSDAAQSFECRDCEENFQCRNDLNHHVMTVHGKEELRVYECGLCSYRFKQAHILRNHFIQRHLLWKNISAWKQPSKRGKKSRKLADSGCSAKTAEEEHSDQAVEEDTRPFVCAVCKQRFQEAYQVNVHIQHVHNTRKGHQAAGIVPRPAVIGRNTSTAAIADDRGSVRGNLSSGSSEHFQCKVCQAEFKYRYHLRHHVSLVHGNVGLGMFECGVCGRRLKHARQLKAHVVAHHRKVKSQQKPHQCSLCGQKYTLFRHSRKHKKSCPAVLGFPNLSAHPEDWGHGQSPGSSVTREGSDPQSENDGSPSGKEGGGEKERVTCHVCGKITYSGTALGLHLFWLHPELRQLPCSVCGKPYKTERNLSAHMKSHNTDENPTVSVCHLCGKTFTSRYNLKCHINTHTNEKPHKCDLCPKGFNSPTGLRVHRLRHKQIKHYSCEICGKMFYTSSCLNSHAIVHTDQRPQSCDLCGKTFRRACGVRRHKRRVHP
ncbi:hypothetical protein ACOMHN_039044 [Nucella lapillus]